MSFKNIDHPLIIVDENAINIMMLIVNISMLLINVVMFDKNMH